MYRLVFKRFFDIFVALFALPFWLLILAILGPIIYFTDKGPIFYNAPRLGKDGKIYKMYKFRSMKINAPDLRNNDGSTFNSEDDPRLTKIGKFIRKTSIDETPQIFNVLKGDMSIIGPRPDLPEHQFLYTADEFQKLAVRPGITGYNQALFRNSIPWKQRLINDIYYVDNLSLIFDIKIIFKTVSCLINKSNVYVTSSAEELVKDYDKQREELPK